MIYCYYVSCGLASLHKMYASCNDVDEAPKKIGKFKTDLEAKAACLTHFNKACALVRKSYKRIEQNS